MVVLNCAAEMGKAEASFLVIFCFDKADRPLRGAEVSVMVEEEILACATTRGAHNAPLLLKLPALITEFDLIVSYDGHRLRQTVNSSERTVSLWLPCETLGETVGARIQVGMIAMGDIYQNSGSQIGGQGSGSTNSGSFHQGVVSGTTVDFGLLATELAEIRTQMARADLSHAESVEIDAVAEAESAAGLKDGPAVLRALSKVGSWTINTSTKVGVGVATAAIKAALGL